MLLLLVDAELSCEWFELQKMYRIFSLLFFMCIGRVLDVEGLPEGVYWRDYIPREIPDDAFEAAPGLYLGQALHQGNLLVTTIYPHIGTAVGELGGQKNFKHNIKILCTMWPDKLCWEFVNFSEPIESQMKNVVKGGYEEGLASELYIGKKLIHREWKIGKVIEMMHPNKGLYLWTEEASVSRQYQFHILKYNCTSNK
ncbi:hypothetical protein AMK59_1287 [Oryctes borbonicus]|uniref:Uncharacterized protein n=1 Tax=Oryctes borbonicus TaxID=1629725 RepID=A0A0T6BAJ8_9SCAR|nr:hypothetical protein AMK59_1287 [Oryctes borbonicus]